MPFIDPSLDTPPAAMIGVSVIFQYAEDFDRLRVVSIAENARDTFEGCPG